MGDNVNHYTNVDHPIPTLWEKGTPRQFQYKSLRFPFNWVSSYVPFFAKGKGMERPLFEGARSGVTVWDYPQEHLVVARLKKVSPIVNLKESYTSFAFH